MSMNDKITIDDNIKAKNKKDQQEILFNLFTNIIYGKIKILMIKII